MPYRNNADMPGEYKMTWQEKTKLYLAGAKDGLKDFLFDRHGLRGLPLVIGILTSIVVITMIFFHYNGKHEEFLSQQSCSYFKDFSAQHVPIRCLKEYNVSSFPGEDKK